MHMGEFRRDARILSRIAVWSARSRLVVPHLSIRRPDVAIARLPQSQTEVDVIKGDRQRLVQALELVVRRLAHHEARGSKSIETLMHASAPEIPRRPARKQAVRVPCYAAETEDDAPVL